MRAEPRLDSRICRGYGYLTRFDLGDGPGCMFGNQRLRIDRDSPQSRQVIGIADIAERNTDVPQEPASLYAFNWRTAKQISEFRFTEFQIIAKPECGCYLARGKSRFARCLSESVPRACFEAIVAAKDSISNERTQLKRDRPLQFDRQIRNASPCVQPVSRCDCVCGTSCDATRAGAATVASRRICRQLERRQNFRKEEPGAELFVDQHCALAVPADAGSGGKVPLEDRTGVDVTFLGSAEFPEKRIKPFQLRLDHIVIIVT